MFTLRQIQVKDLNIRLKWMNRHEIYENMHFATPVTIEGLNSWYQAVIQDSSRFDCVFEDENNSVVAMGGLTHIDTKVKKAELYIFVNPDSQCKGHGTLATRLLCQYGFERLQLNKIYLLTNESNIRARRVYEKIGFQLEGRMRNERALSTNRFEDRLYYGVLKNEIKTNSVLLPTFSKNVIVHQVAIDGIKLDIIRDDLYPEVGGAGKSRKAAYYEAYLKVSGYNAVVTCGGVQSNHNRAIALMCARNGWKCHLCIQGTEERFLSENGNALLCRLSGAECEIIRSEETAEAMNRAMKRLAAEGYKPYYCHGGGTDLPGGIAYVDAVEELSKLIEKPDYLFLASGTGSTQAGIIVGLDRIGWKDVKCIGISIARPLEKGEKRVIELVNELTLYYNEPAIEESRIFFNDDYIAGGYELYTPLMSSYLLNVMRQTGIMFDTTYSGKAFYGMMNIIQNNQLRDKRIAFWHTGGLMNLMK